MSRRICIIFIIYFIRAAAIAEGIISIQLDFYQTFTLCVHMRLR